MKVMLIAILLLFFSCAFAQDPETRLISVPDSLKIPRPENRELLSTGNIAYSEITAGMLAEPIRLEAPAFDISQYLTKGWITSYSTYEFKDFPFYRAGNLFTAGLPFFHSGTIFHQASIRLGDKIMLGGNSFGLNSIMHAPLPHPGVNQWDTRGASMFMQYKVNKNFRIETRISVTNNQFHP